MASNPISLPPALPSELLEYVLAQQAYPTTLLICQPRGVFLSSLLKAVQHTSPPAASPPPDPDLEIPVPANETALEPTQEHSLLIPTLHQVATSRFINLVFIPTVTHLRAYLAAFPDEVKDGPPGQEWENSGRKEPLLVIYGVVGLHKDTSEWSAQGLGNSLAACVEAGWRNGRRVIVLEETTVEDIDEGDIGGERLGDEGDEGDEVDAEKTTGRGPKVWEERVPMLNGSFRRAGLESEDGGWSGRTIEVGRILARWFKFRKGEWESDNTA